MLFDAQLKKIAAKKCALAGSTDLYRQAASLELRLMRHELVRARTGANKLQRIINFLFKHCH